MSSTVHKAVIPAAGYGTRFLPITKAIPKEMLPVADKPVIHYVVEEAVNSGITEILIVISRGKESIMDYFDRNLELESRLREKGSSLEALNSITHITERCKIFFMRQPEIKGLGDAVLQAERFVENKSFVVLLGDTIFDATTPVTQKIIDTHKNTGNSVVALQMVSRDKISRYGVAECENPQEQDELKIIRMIEKPSINETDSNLVFCARYLFCSEIFECLKRTTAGKNGEIQLTDAMQNLHIIQPFTGLRINNQRYDIGNPQGLFEANKKFLNPDRGSK